MTGREAAEVVALLNAAFPRESLEPETVEVYVRELAALRDPETAREAARLLVRRSPRFPTIAEFREVYRARSSARSGLPELPPAGPADRGELLPEIRAFVARLEERQHVPEAELERALVPADPGDCADCGDTGERVTFGDSGRLLCRSCALSRLKVAAMTRHDEPATHAVAGESAFAGEHAGSRSAS